MMIKLIKKLRKLAYDAPMELETITNLNIINFLLSLIVCVYLIFSIIKRYFIVLDIKMFVFLIFPFIAVYINYLILKWTYLIHNNSYKSFMKIIFVFCIQTIGFTSTHFDFYINYSAIPITIQFNLSSTTIMYINIIPIIYTIYLISKIKWYKKYIEKKN